MSARGRRITRPLGAPHDGSHRPGLGCEGTGTAGVQPVRSRRDIERARQAHRFRPGRTESRQERRHEEHHRTHHHRRHRGQRRRGSFALAPVRRGPRRPRRHRLVEHEHPPARAGAELQLRDRPDRRLGQRPDRHRHHRRVRDRHDRPGRRRQLVVLGPGRRRTREPRRDELRALLPRRQPHRQPPDHGDRRERCRRQHGHAGRPVHLGDQPRRRGGRRHPQRQHRHRPRLEPRRRRLEPQHALHRPLPQR
jgi:hypothetical protein